MTNLTRNLNTNLKLVTNHHPNSNFNKNPNSNPSPNPVLIVQILTAHTVTVPISPGNFTVQILTVQMSSGYRRPPRRSLRRAGIPTLARPSVVQRQSIEGRTRQTGPRQGRAEPLSTDERRAPDSGCSTVLDVVAEESWRTVGVDGDKAPSAAHADTWLTSRKQPRPTGDAAAAAAIDFHPAPRQANRPTVDERQSRRRRRRFS